MSIVSATKELFLKEHILFMFHNNAFRHVSLAFLARVQASPTLLYLT